MSRRRRNHGEGSIFQRSDGRWCAQLDLGWQSGKRQRKYIYGSTAAEVQDALLKARTDHQHGFPVVAERQTVGYYLASWLEDVVKPSVRPLTHEQYSQHVRLYLAPALGHHRLSKLGVQHVRALVRQKLADQLSPRTVQLSLATLRRALGQALKDGLIARNVAALVDGPHQAGSERRTFSPDEARVFLDAVVGDKLEALYTVTVTLGLRMGEALGLRWSDINFERRTLTINQTLERIGRGHGSKLVLAEPKTSRSRRTLSLSALAVKALRQHYVRQIESRLAAGPDWQDSGLVFPTGRGTPFEPRNLYRDFHIILRRAGLPVIRFHDLRHSAASLMLAQGIQLRLIQEILGHSSIAVTANLYAHVGEQLKREAADAMDAMFGGTA
jgi:integrase